MAWQPSVGPVGEVEHTDDELHGVIRSLPNRHRGDVVDEEVDSSRLPIHGIAMKLADVQRIRVGGELLGKSWVAEPMNATTQGHHRDAIRPDHRTVSEDLDQADLAAALGWSSRPTIHAENIDRGLRVARQVTSTCP